MCFHFPVMPRIYYALRDEKAAPIIDVLADTPAIPAGGQWGTFLRNHDELTLEMVTRRGARRRCTAGTPPTRGCAPTSASGAGWRRCSTTPAPRSSSSTRCCSRCPGSPCLYYGDEIGMGDNIWLHDRDAVRTPMQWTPDRNAGFSTRRPGQALPAGHPVAGLPLQPRQRRGADGAPAPRCCTGCAAMLAVRREHPVFGLGDFERAARSTTSAVLAFVRASTGASATREDRRHVRACVNNLSSPARRPTTITLPERVRGRAGRETCSAARLPRRRAPTARITVTLGSRDFFWLRAGAGRGDDRWLRSTPDRDADARAKLELRRALDGRAALVRRQGHAAPAAAARRLPARRPAQGEVGVETLILADEAVSPSRSSTRCRSTYRGAPAPRRRARARRHDRALGAGRRGRSTTPRTTRCTSPSSARPGPTGRYVATWPRPPPGSGRPGHRIGDDRRAAAAPCTGSGCSAASSPTPRSSSTPRSRRGPAPTASADPAHRQGVPDAARPATNPDVVLQSALARRRLAAGARPLGSAAGAWHQPGPTRRRAGSGHLAFAQEFLPGVEDAWRVALRGRRGRHRLHRPRARPGRGDRRGAPRPSPRVCGTEEPHRGPSRPSCDPGRTRGLEAAVAEAPAARGPARARSTRCSRAAVDVALARPAAHPRRLPPRPGAARRRPRLGAARLRGRAAAAAVGAHAARPVAARRRRDAALASTTWRQPRPRPPGRRGAVPATGRTAAERPSSTATPPCWRDPRTDPDAAALLARLRARQGPVRGRLRGPQPPHVDRDPGLGRPPTLRPAPRRTRRK